MSETLAAHGGGTRVDTAHAADAAYCGTAALHCRETAICRAIRVCRAIAALRSVRTARRRWWQARIRRRSDINRSEGRAVALHQALKEIWRRRRLIARSRIEDARSAHAADRRAATLCRGITAIHAAVAELGAIRRITLGLGRQVGRDQKPKSANQGDNESDVSANR